MRHSIPILIFLIFVTFSTQTSWAEKGLAPQASAGVIFPLPKQTNARAAFYSKKLAPSQNQNQWGLLLQVKYIWDPLIPNPYYLPSTWILYFIPVDNAGKPLIEKPILVTERGSQINHESVFATDTGFGIVYAKGQNMILREYRVQEQTLSKEKIWHEVAGSHLNKEHGQRKELRQMVWSSFGEKIYLLAFDEKETLELLQGDIKSKPVTLKKYETNPTNPTDIQKIDFYVDSSGLYTFWNENKFYCEEVKGHWESCTYLCNNHCSLDGTNCQTQKEQISPDLINKSQLANIAKTHFPSWFQGSNNRSQFKEKTPPSLQILFR